MESCELTKSYGLWQRLFRSRAWRLPATAVGFGLFGAGAALASFSIFPLIYLLPIKQRIELFLRNKPARYDQIAYTFVAVSVSSQSAPRTARLSSRCRERCPSLWVLRPGENARTKIEYAAGVFVRI